MIYNSRLIVFYFGAIFTNANFMPLRNALLLSEFNLENCYFRSTIALQAANALRLPEHLRRRQLNFVRDFLACVKVVNLFRSSDSHMCRGSGVNIFSKHWEHQYPFCSFSVTVIHQSIETYQAATLSTSSSPVALYNRINRALCLLDFLMAIFGWSRITTF